MPPPPDSDPLSVNSQPVSVGEDSRHHRPPPASMAESPSKTQPLRSGDEPLRIDFLPYSWYPSFWPQWGEVE